MYYAYSTNTLYTDSIQDYTRRLDVLCLQYKHIIHRQYTGLYEKTRCTVPTVQTHYTQTVYRIIREDSMYCAYSTDTLYTDSIQDYTRRPDVLYIYILNISISALC